MNFNILSLIEQFVNKINYKLKFNRFLNSIAIFDIPLKHFAVRIKAVDILIFINLNIKYYYDKHYIPIFFKEKDFAFLYLYKSYNILINTVIIKKLK